MCLENKDTGCVLARRYVLEELDSRFSVFCAVSRFSRARIYMCVCLRERV